MSWFRSVPLGRAFAFAALLLFLPRTGRPADGSIELIRVPAGGLQPQSLVSTDGTLHLLFLRGEQDAADVWYARRPKGAAVFTEPVRVNSVAGSAIAVGTIRGVQFALDPTGSPFVVWNGSGKSDRHSGAPLWFTRARVGGGFEPERDVIRTTAHLDGGGSVALGRPGQVFAVWHSAPPDTNGETNRAVFLSVSEDTGANFGPEVRIDRPGDGVCACCGLRALGRSDGTLAVLYRSASEGGDFRDMTLLLRPADGGETRRIVLDRWSLRSCPMSSFALTWAGGDLLAAWETRDDVRLASIHVATGVLTRLDPPPGTGRRKHPALAIGDRGDFLLAWLEDTGWNRGGSVAWQHYDAKFRPTSIQGRREGVPVWGLASAFAADGRFGLVY